MVYTYIIWYIYIYSNKKQDIAVKSRGSSGQLLSDFFQIFLGLLYAIQIPSSGYHWIRSATVTRRWTYAAFAQFRATSKLCTVSPEGVDCDPGYTRSPNWKAIWKYWETSVLYAPIDVYVSKGTSFVRSHQRKMIIAEISKGQLLVSTPSTPTQINDMLGTQPPVILQVVNWKPWPIWFDDLPIQNGKCP